MSEGQTFFCHSSLVFCLSCVSDVAGMRFVFFVSFFTFKGSLMLSCASQVFCYHLKLSLCRERFASELLGIRLPSGGSHVWKGLQSGQKLS